MIDQKLELLSVSSTDKSAIFKVILNGEEKIFIGKVPKGYLFDSIPAVKTDSDVLKTFKFNSPMRTIDSFQKSYSIDKKVITDDDKKKDIIIPVVVSQDIVQLGNYMFSMSKMTNNTILYLLYKNRLVNRYVDDKTNITYYYLDDEFANKDSAEILAALRNENSPWSFTKFGDTENNLYAIEKKTLITSDNAELKANYKNLPGYTIFQDRQVVSEKEDEMPFSMLFEYDEDYQYTDEESQIFVNFLQLKNHLSPFFNVEVDKDNAFKAWRKFKKIANSNNTIWMTYNYETPRTLTTTTLTEDDPIIAESGVCDINGKFKNFAVQDYYSPFYISYPSGSWAKNTSIPDKSSILGFMNEKSGYNKNLDNFENGFTLHTEFDTEQFKSRFLGFNHLKEQYEANNGSYMTAQEIAAAFLELNSAFAAPVYDEDGNDISIQVYNDENSKYYNERVYYTVEVKAIDETDSSKGTNFTIKLVRDKTSSTSTDIATIDLPYPIPRGTLGIGYVYADEIIMSRNTTLGNSEYWTNTEPVSNVDSAFVSIDKGIDTVNGQIPSDNVISSLPHLNTLSLQPRNFIIEGVNNNNPSSKYFYDYDRKLYPTVISDTNPISPSTFFKWIMGSFYYNDVGISNYTSNGSAWSSPNQSNANYYANGNLYRIKMGFTLPELENPNYIPDVLTAIYGNDTKKILWDNLDPAISPEDIESEFVNNCPTTKPADNVSAARKIAYALYVIDTGISEDVSNPGNTIDISENNIKVKIAPNSELEKLYKAGNNIVKAQLRNFNPTFTTRIRASKTYDKGKPTEKTIIYKLVTKQDLVRGYLYYARKYNRWYTGDTITFKNLRIRCNTPAMFGITYQDYPEDYLYKNDARYYNYFKNGVEHYNTIEDVDKAYPDKTKIDEGTIISIGYGDERYIQYLGGQDYYGWLYRFTDGEWKQILDSNSGTIIRNSQPDIRSFTRVFSLMKARKPITTENSYNNYWTYNFSSVSGTQYDMVIDLFGSVIGNKFINNQTSDSIEIVNAIKQSSDKTTFVDLTVSFKDSTGQDSLIITTYINGKPVQTNPITFDKNSREFKYLKKTFTDLSNLKFNTYGQNHYNSPVEGNPEALADQFTQYPTNYVVFNFKNMAMWNYPLSASQIKQIKDRLLTGKSINDILTDYYEVNQYNEFTQTNKDTTEKANTIVVGRVFNIEKEENNLNYTFDSENEEIYNQKLFKVQDFDYLDKLGGIHRLLIQNGRKSNLYSVRLKNTGLVPPENSGYELGTKDRQDYEAYYNECKNMLETAVKTICDKVEPVNVKLFKVMIDS